MTGTTSGNGTTTVAPSDGLMLHRLTVDPTLDMRPAVARAVRALMAKA